MTEQKTDKNLIGTIFYKSVYAPFIVGGTGLLLLGFIADLKIKILAVFLIALSAINYYFVKDRKVIEIFSDHLIIYPNHDDILKINTSDIAEWNVNSHGRSAVYLKLTDGRSAFIRTFNTEKAGEYLKKALPDKSTFQQSVSRLTTKDDGFFHVLKKHFK